MVADHSQYVWFEYSGLQKQERPDISLESSISSPNVSTATSPVSPPDRALKLETMVERCGGDVVRLVDEPASVLGTVLGMGCDCLRMRNEVAMVGLDSGALSFERRGDEPRVQSETASMSIDPRAWGSGWLRIGSERTRSVLAIFDRRGQLMLEVLLDRPDLEALASVLPSLEHRHQRPIKPDTRGRESEATIRPEVDRDVLEREWARETEYRTIRDLEAGFRLNRCDLFEFLSPRWASTIGTSSVAEMTRTIASMELSCRVEYFESGMEVSMHTDDLRASGRGGPLVAADPGHPWMIDPNSADTAFVVRKPTRDGLVTALELFGAAGTLQARLRLETGADHDQRLLWRSSFPFGRLAASQSM